MSTRSSTSPPRRAQVERTADTRRRLVDATVGCLADFGYARTTTQRIARRAGLTRGALQYQFPDPLDLYTAVIETLYADQIRHFAATVSPRHAPAKRLAALLDTAIAIHRTPGHVAFLELWVAARSDAGLRARIEPAVRRTEEAIDESIAQAFRDARIARARLVDLRRLLQATLRGLALAEFLEPEQPTAAEGPTRGARTPGQTAGAARQARGKEASSTRDRRTRLLRHIILETALDAAPARMPQADHRAGHAPPRKTRLPSVRR